ncbi:isoprenylcysteine carboxylmethyltransferase family protein [Alteromonas aestuariivivens]|uniref:Isoprenylcysteine carboxylmethyltransferase family protein n=1 Tax=Alteromonas aestuariivivens TaxID=1938339 RepID=A0A3D8M3J7_9ALTE|nr:isoprenylcysteine carboxylmethyltransferase family protein [Alteromonas aestuariivivens]RDV24303.1 isoprenylcysteine carboxylmethyltransferase family protein [Alteromonas aestuariivivens]
MRKLELKIPPVVVLLLTLLMAWQIARSQLLPLPSFFQATGCVIILLGCTFVFNGAYTFRKHKTTLDPRNPDKTSQLVKSGAFKYTRNPMYLGMLFIQLGAVGVLQEGFSLVSVPILMAYLQKFQIRPEERQMRRLFGQVYKDYCKQTRRWL